MNPSTRLSDSFREKINRPSTRALNLGFIYFKNGEFNEAEKLARESLGAEKSDKGYRLLGEVLLAQNRNREALEAFSQSLEMNPRQEFCLNKVCELIEPNPASVERLEFWAHHAARHGFLDISSNFVRASQVARQAGFPNNAALTKVAKDITQAENRANSSISLSFNSGRPSLNASTSSSKLEESMEMANKSISQILDEVKQLHSANVSQENQLSELREQLKELTLLVASKANDASPGVHVKELSSASSTPSAQVAQKVSSAPAAPAPPKASVTPVASAVPSFQSVSAPAPAFTSAAPAFTSAAPVLPSPAPALFGSLAAPKLNFFQEAIKENSNNANTNIKFGAPSSFSSFSSPSNSQPLFAGFGTPPQPIFGGPPQPVFGAKPSPIFAKPPANAEDDENSDPEAEHIDVSQLKLPQLKNIPAKIEVKTGEEDEENIYSQRAKIYRFDQDTKEWKERGIGDLKILMHKQTKKYRILMRREQVHKIAINCYITSEMEFKPRKNSDNSAEFTAVDCSDDQPTLSGFVVRFKTKELLDVFRAKVDEIKSTIAAGGPGSPNKPPSGSIEGQKRDEVKQSQSANVAQQNQSNERRAPMNELTSLLASKPSSAVSAGSVNSPLNAPTPQVAPKVASAAAGATVPSSQTAPAPASAFPSPGAPLFGGFAAPKSNLFQEAIKENNATNSTPNSAFSFKFGAPSSFSSFSSPSNSQPLFAGFGAPPAPIFGGPPQPVFGAKPSPIFAKPPGKAEDDENSDPEAEHIDVSQLKLPQLKNIPAKIEVKTGEEDEENIYSQRAKIFRFDQSAKEWKERGIGDLKILMHKQTKKYRILMRREQVHKIAINCYITSEMELKPRKNSDNSAEFTAVDCSDDQPTLSGFVVRFKTKELLDVFRAKVEEIKSIIAAGGPSSPSKPQSGPAGASEVEIVYERKPKPALIEEARKLMLPDNFYNHLTNEKCTGCRGCPDQDDDS